MGREDQGLAKSAGRYQVVPRTLCFVTSGESVLLLRGAPNKRLWAGRLNGLGGHVEPGEDIYQAVMREVEEESGLRPYDVHLRLVVHADAGDPTTGIVIFVFTAVAATRLLRESAEGSLAWYPRDNLPLNEAVEDLPLLLPRILAMGPADPPFFAAYRYDANDRLTVTFATVE